MGLLKSEKGSNAAQPSSDDGPTAGSLGMVGFTKADYPAQRPAKSNADVSTTDTAPGLGNDGTNMSAYDEQSADINGKTGK
jgi:hypothetical protein